MKSFEEHLAIEQYKTESQRNAAIKRRYDRRRTREELRQAKYTATYIAVVIVWAIFTILVAAYFLANQNTEITEPPAQPVVIEEPVVIDSPPATEYAVLPEPIPELFCLGEFTITHYCPCELCCGEWADGITYTGTEATEGRTIAVDPDVIPLGSTVIIDGHEYIAEDIGGAIQGNRIDIFMESHEAALIEGVTIAEVYAYG